MAGTFISTNDELGETYLIHTIITTYDYSILLHTRV